MNNKTEWGIAGMGVMGTSLSRNFAQKGITLSLFNRYLKGSEEQVANKKKQRYPELNTSLAFEEISPFVSSLETPRKILLMLPAGKPTDAFLDQLVPLLQVGDVVMDGGNTHYLHTEKRAKALHKKGILFLGIGVSGGEEGALYGPSLMIGGALKAFELVKNDLIKIAAKNKTDKACCGYFGAGGAGHFVKMVHNGIEYAEMQLLAEVYALSQSKGLNDDIQSELCQWNTTSSKSYLLEITARLLNYKENQVPFVELIQDQASNKGTGAWATAAGTTLGYPNTLMATALHARYISSFKSKRVQFAEHYATEKIVEKISFTQLKMSYDLSRWINHHQGFEMLTLAAKEYHWKLNLSEVAAVWAEGCIIKSDLIDLCINLLKDEKSLLLSTEFKILLEAGKDAWKKTLQQAIENETAVLCMQNSWSYFAALKTEKSAANIIQAQRDYFGAHGFHRIDNKEVGLQHGPWSSSNQN
ncbi:NADP-dependent phosphogluconate dehydrogenase [Flavobacteriaceae bacterium]|nr:NADP-dependent phosphogluconate dehydrogenase [Flavobacteriaceae bacterium]